MQNHAVAYHKPKRIVTVTYPGGSVSDSTTESVGVTDGFTFSGFGVGDPVRRLIATPGEYHIFRYWSMSGSATIIGKDYGALGLPITSGGQYSTRDGLADQGHASAHGDLLGNLHPSYSSTVYNTALTRLWDKIKESELNLAVSLAEGRETYRGIRGISDYLSGRGVDVLRRLRQTWRALRRNPSLLLSRAWLTSKYGIIPVYLDFWNLANLTGKFFDEGVTHVGSCRLSEEIHLNQGVSLLGGSGIRSRIRGRRVQQCRISVTAGVTSTAAFDRSRLTSLNPLSIAWELVPLSFVADWFYDLGGYLQNMEAALGSGLTFKRGHYTELALVDAVDVWSGTEGPVTLGWSTRELTLSDQARVQRIQKRRTRLTDFPWPRAPRIEAKLGWQRITSLAALARTILLGKVR
jgi:hypothetical protein